MKQAAMFWAALLRGPTKWQKTEGHFPEKQALGPTAHEELNLDISVICLSLGMDTSPPFPREDCSPSWRFACSLERDPENQAKPPPDSWPVETGIIIQQQMIKTDGNIND